MNYFFQIVCKIEKRDNLMPLLSLFIISFHDNLLRMQPLLAFRPVRA